MWDDFVREVLSLWEYLTHWWDQILVVVPRDEYKPLLDISGFLGVLAFSVAVFTLSGPKFQIRQSTAFIPFKPLFFGVLLVSAVITFLLEAFIIFEIPLPAFLDPNRVNFVIATLIAGLILYWMKVCFIRPPRFTRFTAKKFLQQAYVYIANGSKEEMLAFAREAMRESPRLIRYTPRLKRHHFEDSEAIKLSSIQTSAHFLTALLSDPRFCDVVAKELPSFPAHMVEIAIEQKRYDVPIHLMVKRVVVAMLHTPGSALYVENEWLEQGLTANTKPITRSIFSNWHLLEGSELELDAPLDLGYPYARSWDTEAWRVYFGISREYLRGLTSNGRVNWHSNGVRYILKTTEKAYDHIGDLKKYKDTFSPFNPTWHAREANDFLKDLVKFFDENRGWVDFNRSDNFRYGRDLSSDIAALYFNVIFSAAQVNTKEFRMWDVQHNTVWQSTEDHEVKGTAIMKMVRRKLRRLIWDEISRMNSFPNYKGAAYVRFCLNVLGFYDETVHRKDPLSRDSWPLTKVVADWVRENYQTIALSHPPVAAAMLPANVAYDRDLQALVRKRDDTLTGVPQLKSLALDPPRCMPAS